MLGKIIDRPYIMGHIDWQDVRKNHFDRPYIMGHIDWHQYFDVRKNHTLYYGTYCLRMIGLILWDIFNLENTMAT